MKICVCGSRYWKDKNYVEDKLDKLLEYNEDLSKITILQGGATGVDAIAKAYAERRGISVVEYPADWDKLGKAAGPIRNEKMIADADIVVAFLQRGKENKGTKNALQCANRFKKTIFQYEN